MGKAADRQGWWPQVICAQCKQDYPREEFGPSAENWPSHRQCHACSRAAMQIKRHGITAQDRAIVADAQGGCAICGHTETGGKGWVVDHDRSCCPGDKSCPKCRRGIVCQWCNSVLGYAFDRVQILRGAIEYLERHAAAENPCSWHMPLACAPRMCGNDATRSSTHVTHARDGLTKTRQAKRDDMTLSNAREIQAAIDINGETA